MVKLRFMDTLVLAVVGVVVLTTWPITQVESSSVAPVGIAVYRRFHANDFLIAKSIPCTYEEKVCFRYNVFKVGGKCVNYTEALCKFTGNRTEYLRGSGHLVAMCEEDDPCPGYRMAYDGRCYPKEMVHDVICGCDAEPTKHVLGGMECRCSPPTPIHVQQPEEDGKCRIPDLRFPLSRGAFLEQGYSLKGFEGYRSMNCSADQARCFSTEKVWVQEGRGCFPLRERGPCPVEHLVVLNRQAALQGRAEGVCVHERGGCPQGQRRVAFDQRCYNYTDLQLLRIGHLYLNQYGNIVLISRVSGSEIYPDANYFEEIELTSSKDKDTNLTQCIVSLILSGIRGTVAKLRPLCGADDRSQCPLFEVESGAPKPILD